MTDTQTALDTATRRMLRLQMQHNSEWSGNITGSNLRALDEVNALRRDGGLPPLPRDEVEQWPGELEEYDEEQRNGT